MKAVVQDIFGHQLRVRVNGLLIENDKILLVKHTSLGIGQYLWIPPGGGMEYGMSAKENLSREFHEETGLTIQVKNFLFVHEFMQKPLHAMELFFVVERIKGQVTTGRDPEMAGTQIIEEVKFLSIQDIKEERKEHLHQMLRQCDRLEDILNSRGYFQN